MDRGLYRSRDNRVLAGVAGGLAERFGLPAWVIRLIFILMALPGGIPGVLIYLLCWVIIPLEPATGRF